MLSVMRLSGRPSAGTETAPLKSLLRCREFGLHFLKNPFALALTDAGDVVLVFQQYADGVGYGLRIERHLVQLVERVGPVYRLGDAGGLEQLDLPKLLDEGHDLGGKPLAGLRNLAPYDLKFTLRVRIIHPMIEAPPLQRVMDLARAVGGDDHDGWLLGFDGAKFRHRDLEIGQDFEQKCLKCLVGAVKLVDKEDGAAPSSPVNASRTGRRIRYFSEKTFFSMAARSTLPAASSMRISIICAA